LPVSRHDFVDGDFGSEIGGGAVWVRGYFNRFFKPEFKYSGIGIFSLGSNDSGGQTDGSSHRSFVWGNAYVASEIAHYQTAAVNVLSHETGHCLGLDDLSYDRYGYFPEAPVFCPEVYFEGDESEDTKYRDSAWPQNPIVPSLMNYAYSGMGVGQRAKWYTMPSANDGYHSGCSREFLRFSKGLLGTISETSLKEVNPISFSSTATWQDRLLIREMECFVDQGRNYEGFNPYCLANMCRVNWDFDRFDGDPPDPEEGPYAFDLSMGKFGSDFENPPDVQKCTQDELSDRNELGMIQALGKNSLGFKSYDHFQIYKATFNGANTENLAGWAIPKTDTNISFVTAIYPMNQCYAGSDCLSGNCWRDDCVTDSACLSGSCGIDNVCECLTDNQCFSNTCLPTGKCFTDRGVCSCSSPKQCLGTSADEASCHETLNICGPRLRSPSVSKKAARFGLSGSSSIRLTNTGTTSPFVGISDSDLMSIRFDLYSEGISSSEGGQYLLIGGGNFNIWLLRVSDSLSYLVVGSTVMATLRARQWYHIYIWSEQNDGSPRIRASVAPWNNNSGSYLTESDDCAVCEIQCNS